MARCLAGTLGTLSNALDNAFAEAGLGQVLQSLTTELLPTF
ncbi:hypothetical protein [Pantoea piersonii]|nr:hypothetical protein [Pantoea piersonii]